MDIDGVNRLLPNRLYSYKEWRGTTLASSTRDIELKYPLTLFESKSKQWARQPIERLHCPSEGQSSSDDDDNNGDSLVSLVIP